MSKHVVIEWSSNFMIEQLQWIYFPWEMLSLVMFNCISLHKLCNCYFIFYHIWLICCRNIFTSGTVEWSWLIVVLVIMAAAEAQLQLLIVLHHTVNYSWVRIILGAMFLLIIHQLVLINLSMVSYAAFMLSKNLPCTCVEKYRFKIYALQGYRLFGSDSL